MIFNLTFQGAARSSLEIQRIIGEHVVINDQLLGEFCGSAGRKMMIRRIVLALIACP